MINTKIMQTTSDDHHQIRKAIFGVSQYIFHTSGTLDTGDGMLDFDANFGDFAIVFFLFFG